MKRVVPLVLLVLGFPGPAASDGCPPETCGVMSVAEPGAPLLALRPFGPSGPYKAYDSRTGKLRFRLPFGISSADGRAFFAATNSRRATWLTRYDAQTGKRLSQRRLSPRLALTATSANGRHVVLTDARSSRHETSLWLVHAPSGRARAIKLAGSFSVEAISNDGRRLFVVQHLRRGYRVRLYDLESHSLVPGELRPQNEDEPMSGFAAHAIASRSGRWLLTLYVKPKAREAFVHALDLRRALAYCLDLPGEAAATTMTKYALALSPDERTLFALNPMLGAVASIRLGTLERTAVVRFRGRADTSSYPNAAVSPRGATIYFGGVRRLWAYDVAARAVRGPYAVGPIGGFAFTPDGRRLTVVRPFGGALALDAQTGSVLRR